MEEDIFCEFLDIENNNTVANTNELKNKNP